MSTMTDTTSMSTGTDVIAGKKLIFATESAPANGSTDPNKKAVRRPKAGRTYSRYNHLFAIHSKNRVSPLTRSDQTTEQNYNGFRNLMALVLVVSNLRLMLENFKKYGVLICISCHDYRRDDVRYGSWLYFSVPFHLLIAYIIELVAARKAQAAVARRKKTDAELPIASKQRQDFQLAWYFIATAHAINATANLGIASYVVYNIIHHPGIGTVCELHAIIVWLKVCSYALTNRDLRHAYLYPDPAAHPLPELYKSCPYPQNITLKNLGYFWWAPTLIYQPVYPRTSHIRWNFVFKRIAEIISLSIVIWVASAQYAVPLLQNSLDHIATLNLMGILERLMKLSTISLFCWLAGFFLVFQSSLNGLAELMRFGDREFYGDWWNSFTLRSYWTEWNKPVYHFMKRHIYSPLVGRGVPPQLAQVVVFVFSGLLHELLVGVPTHNILWVAFAGMMWQIPLILLTDPLMKAKSHTAKTIGNMTFWITFCLVGQPLAALLYFFAWQAKYGSVSGKQTFFTK